MVWRLFAELTNKRLRCGAFRSVVNLEAAVNRYLRDHNRAPKPFIWTAGAKIIIRKIQRAKRGSKPPGRPEEFHLQPPTEPCVK